MKQTDEQRIKSLTAQNRKLKSDLKRAEKRPSIIPDPADKDTIAYLRAEVDRLQRELGAIQTKNVV